MMPGAPVPRDRWLLIFSVVILGYSGCGAWEAQSASLSLAERTRSSQEELLSTETLVKSVELRLAAMPASSPADTLSAANLLKRAEDLNIRIERIASVGDGYRVTATGSLESVLALAGSSATELSLTRRSAVASIFEVTMTLSPSRMTPVSATAEELRRALRRMRPAPRLDDEQDSAGVAGRRAVAALFSGVGRAPVYSPTVPTAVPLARPVIEAPLDYLGLMQTGGAATTGIFKSKITGIVASSTVGRRLEGWEIVRLNTDSCSVRAPDGTLQILRRRR